MFLFFGAFLLMIIIVVGLRVVYGLLAGLALMHVIGIIHHEWLPGLPTLGYWWSTLIAFLVAMAISPPFNAEVTFTRSRR